MAKKRIPPLPLPLETAKKISKPFLGTSSKLIRFFPGLDIKLSQAEIPLKGKEYVAISLFSFLFWFLLTFGLLVGIISITAFTLELFLMALFASLTIGFLSFLFTNLYPSLVVLRKTRDIDRNLLFALRHLLIQVRSGVTLYDAMASVAEADYGSVSEEFRKAVKEIATGTDVTTALDEMAFKNPSLHFRRVIWQLANSMRAGVDIGESLSSLVASLSAEQRVLIRKYGAQLTPFAVLYLMFAIVLPTLGVAFLVIFSSLTGFPFHEWFLYGILGSVIGFQLMLIAIVKARMPAVEV